MKTKLLITVMLSVATTATTFGQNWQWAQSAGGTFNDAGNSVATDANGNVYMTGYFRSLSITFGTTTLTNANNTGNTDDVFIVKYSPSGNVLWAQRAGGTDFDGGYSVSTDANGNVYITGLFSSPSITFGTTTLTNAGLQDIFIVKYDPSGTVLWAQSAGGTSDDAGTSVSTDANGNVYMTGWFGSPSITFGTTTLTNAGNADIFIVKYSPSGNVLWAQSAGGTSSGDFGHSVSTDATGNVYMTGSFWSSSITFGTTTLTNTGDTADIFIAKYDPSGNVLWAQRAGGTSDDWGISVSTDISGNVYMTGFFYSTFITFGTTTLTNANAGSADIFIVKYSPSGNVLWAQRAGGTDEDRGISVSTDANGNVYMTGWFGIPSITFGTTVLTNAGMQDIFIAKYDPSGTVLWAQSAGGTSYDYGTSVSTDAGGNVYVTGLFASPSITFGTTVLTNAGLQDIFIAKLGSAAGVNEWNNEEGISVYPNPFSAQTVLQTVNLLKNATLTVDNCFGQTVKQIKNISGQTITFNRDNLASGLYFVRLTEENKIFTDKLIITDR